MVFVGETADLESAETIVRLAKEQGLHAEIVEYKDSYVIRGPFEQAPEILEIYRIVLRHPAQQQIPREWKNINILKMEGLTQAIFFFCVAIFILNFIYPDRVLSWMAITDFNSNGDESVEQVLKSIWDYQWHNSFSFELVHRSLLNLREVLSGQVWRLLTPCFYHFGFLHIFFNLLWWKALGSIIQKVKGESYLFLMVLLFGIVPNVFQFIVLGPAFGGLSGVIFGLLGLIGAAKYLDRSFPYPLPKVDMIIIGIWFLLGLFQFSFFNMANICHGVGLGLGVSTAGLSFGDKMPQRILVILLGLALIGGTLFIEIGRLVGAFL